MPEFNYMVSTKRYAQEALSVEAKNLRDGGNKLTGTARDGYYVITKKTDALADYIEITECVENECLEELENFLE